jgi:glyoxylase-like metal-dependent hydrolase (beta-lactamase superfamily II)
MKIAHALLVLALGQTAAVAPVAPPIRELAPDTYLLPGAMLPERGPDGNTVMWVTPAGVVVVDTGRHPWHSDAILGFARSRKLPVAAIVNTHWHLDHSSGNRRIKAVHPAAKMYSTRAVDRALAPKGFLARNYDAARERPADANASSTRREETELFLSTMAAPDGLRPDVPVDRSETLTLAGRKVSVRVAANAVTDADIWLYDEVTGIAVIGDLVTLPAPFFETACPARWQAALDDVWAVPFRLAVPGHGEPMTREQFDAYRTAFGNFRACVASDSAPAACATGWTKDAAAFLTTDADRRQATEFATYYVGMLRKNGGASADCLTK